MFSVDPEQGVSEDQVEAVLEKGDYAVSSDSLLLK